MGRLYNPGLPISGGTLFGNLTLESTDAGATQNPTINLFRNSASPAADDILGGWNFTGKDANGDTVTYANVTGRIRSPTNGAEIGTFMVSPLYNGSARDQFAVDGTFGLLIAPGGGGSRVFSLSQAAIGGTLRWLCDFDTNDLRWGGGTPAETLMEWQYSDNLVSIGGVTGSETIAIPRLTASLPIEVKTGEIHKTRVHTAAGAVTVALTDHVVVVNKSSGAATAVNLPASPSTGLTFKIKDGKGDAAANNITVTPAAGNIDGGATYVMNTNYEAVEITYNGTEWNVVAAHLE